MPGTIRKGDVVQRLEGGPVMTVVDVREGPGGSTLVDTVLVHGDPNRVEPYPSEQLKVINMDSHEDFDDDSDDDHDE